jgi:hypothetical protein
LACTPHAEGITINDGNDPAVAVVSIHLMQCRVAQIGEKGHTKGHQEQPKRDSVKQVRPPAAARKTSYHG